MESTGTSCPHLGLHSDASLCYSYPSESHRCYALRDTAEFAPDAVHQSQYCLTGLHGQCPRFLARNAEGDIAAKAFAPAETPPRPVPWTRLAIWGIAAILLVVAVWQLLRLLAPPATPPATLPPSAVQTTLTPDTASAWPTPPPATVLAVAPPPTATPVPIADNNTPATTAQSNEIRLEITPAPAAAGWVGSQEARGNHFGDSFLHAGIYQDEVIHSALQFDLTRVARGAPILSVALELTGLDDKRLNPDANGTWEVRWLAPEINEEWSRRSFQDIHNAKVLQSLLPAVSQDQLAPLVVNRFEFNQEQRTLLERAIVDQQTLIAFRLDGPQAGADNLFTWDSGYGPATLDNRPRLIIVTGPPPPTPPPVPTQDFIVVTSTPTPANVLTAAAIVQTATAYATMVGTPAPTPRSMVTATPTPANEATAQAERLQAGLPPVVIPTATPANEGTQTAIALYATAQALTTGTWTPVPTNAVTATPTPTYVVVTSTPTPANVATLLALVIAEATRTATAGPPTPLPPAVVTATPTLRPPADNSPDTQAALATIAALTVGTYTPTPAAPPPAPTATPLPTIAPANAVADRLKGKIVFWSDRLGEPRPFVVDAGCVARAEGCSQAEPLPALDLRSYQAFLSRRGLSPDEQLWLFVQEDLFRRPQIFVQERASGAVSQFLDVRGATFDPEWAPDGASVALVSDEAGNDEVYVASRDGLSWRRLTMNTWEWDRHPTWSPDGNQIVFYSNRTDGRRQLWVMNADGTGLRNLSNNDYNDWNPVWIK